MQELADQYEASATLLKERIDQLKKNPLDQQQRIHMLIQEYYELMQTAGHLRQLRKQQ